LAATGDSEDPACLAAARRAFLFICAVFSNDYGTDPAQLSGQASVTPPEVMFTSFLYSGPGQTANLRVFGAGNIVAAHARRFATAAVGVIGNGPDPSRISSVPPRHRALFDSPIHGRGIACVAAASYARHILHLVLALERRPRAGPEFNVAFA
jgi:hypothetical protein